jgi:hypothetical protein
MASHIYKCYRCLVGSWMKPLMRALIMYMCNLMDIHDPLLKLWDGT